MKKLILLLSIILLGCNNEKKEDVKVGEYIYLDRYNCIHINQKCFQLNFSNGEEGEEPRYMVQRIEVKKMHEIGRTCSFCVTDEAYKELERQIAH